jgi:hypothetical protein
MSHSFEVGKRYRNRVGEYVVQSIEGDRLTLRYTNGQILVTSAQIQARIWENIQFERQIQLEQEKQRLAKEERKAARQRAARARRERAKPTFDGFQESDFEPKKRGIAWSTRKELGRVLAYALNQRTKGAFGHWIVPRKSGVHVGRKDRYSRETRPTNAALFVSVDEEGVSYGFTVGKPDGKAKVQWPWSLLVAASTESESVREALHSAMKEHDLILDVYAMEVSYGRVARVTVEGEGYHWQQEEAEQEVTRSMSEEELADYLQIVAPKKRSDIHVYKQMAPKAAIKAGAGVAKEIASVFEALVPVYDVSVGS